MTSYPQDQVNCIEEDKNNKKSRNLFWEHLMMVRTFCTEDALTIF